MFKIESYVTPILLSYVDKYVRDFKPADAQVSLWGGGVALHNLVLKADVLQREVSLPFTLVSGRIHELLIQVPWTKIMSEPIVVTIDTIECVLSLNPPTTTDDGPPPDSPSRKAQVVEAPPGYMQALVRRIVSNIALRVHHLIVKYVQDDIVLSLNVKHLAVDSAGPNWEPSFADIDQSQPVIRRLIRLDDLTLCLDRADADGKIRFYQEPLLYRCQLDLRVLTRLVSANTRRASSLAVQLRSTKLAWSVTSEQLTLLLRLYRERLAIGLKPPTPSPKVPSTYATPVSQSLRANSTSSNLAEPARSESWSEWAWSWLPTWMDRDGTDEAPASSTPLPVHFAAFLDEVSLVFKVMEQESVTRKRPRVIIELIATHTAVKSYTCSPCTSKIRFGIRTFTILSKGKCVCGYLNYSATKDEPTVYLRKLEDDSQVTEWVWPDEQLERVEMARAVDEQYRSTPEMTQERPKKEQSDHGEEPSPEPKEQKHDSDEFWKLLGPQIYIELSHEREPSEIYVNPYECTPTDFQYSDWVENCDVKIVLEPMEIRICMGLLHRLSTFKSIYQELPAVPFPDLPRRVLTVEECDALTDNLPERRVSFEVKGLRVRTIPWDHSNSEPAELSPLVLDLVLPHSTVVLNGPLYPYRVCSAACQMPEDAGPLWQGARLHATVNVTSIQALLGTINHKQAKPCARANIRAVAHILLNKEFFTLRESVVFSYSLNIREANVCGSSARLQAALQVPMSLMACKVSVPLRHSTLPNDAFKDEESVVIDLTFEECLLRGYVTSNTNTHIMTLQSAKATALHEPKGGPLKQAWIFSAPDAPSTTPYLRLAIQWCEQPLPASLDYLGLWTEPSAICVDPLFITWLAYQPIIKQTESSQLNFKSMNMSPAQYLTRRRVTPPSSSGRGASKTSAELVHVKPRSVSSSEKAESRGTKNTAQQPPAVEAWWHGDRLLSLHSRLRRMLVNVELGLTLLYVTMSTASALDCGTIRDAMERHASASQRVLALSLGRISMYSASNTKHIWQDIKHDGPTFINTKAAQDELSDTFPWRMRIADISCYTLEVYTGTDRFGRDKAMSALRSKLKTALVASPRTVLELVTTTVTLSVVTKALLIKTAPKKEQKKYPEPDQSKQRMKYFTSGMDFKPTTLREFVRGPASVRKKSQDIPDKNPEPAPTEDPVTSGPIVSLGVHLHADTPPVIVRLEHDQVHIVAAAVHCFRHIATMSQRPPLMAPRTSYTSLGGSHQSFIRSVSELEEQRTPSEETVSDNKSELISIFESRTIRDTTFSIKTFFWFQWVISRMTVVAATHEVKLAIVVDDVIMTVDLQDHYNQLKIKVASASVRHYEKNGSQEWAAGVLGGRVIEAREPANSKEENHFLSVTITQARISNLPVSWKEELNPKLLEQRQTVDSLWEIYATLAPLEMVLDPGIIEQIVSLVQEMAPRSFCPLQKEVPQRLSTWQWPFCYVSAGGLRLLLTSQEESKDKDDTFMFIIGKVIVSPHPENPICRRTIYTGNDSGWLNTPNGIEGRQYEILVKNISIRSAQFEQLISQENGEAEMRKGSSENPALKWTKPVVAPTVTPVLHAVDVDCILAPALYVGDALSCGPAVELNLISDCAIELSLEHLVLAKRVVLDITALKKSADEGILFDEEKHGVCPYASLLMRREQDEILPTLSETSFDDEIDRSTSDLGRFGTDSGVETATSSMKFRQFVENSPSVGPKKYVSVAFIDKLEDVSDYLEVFVTMGTIELSLYTVDDGSPDVVSLRVPILDVSTSEPLIRYMSSEDLNVTETMKSRRDGAETPQGSKSFTETIRNADVGQTKLETPVFPHARHSTGNVPLIHVTLSQPNLYYWRRKTQRTLQLSLFNAWIGLGAGQIQGHWCAPLLSTAKGTSDPLTDIPPALATIKVVAPSMGTSSSILVGARGSVRVDVERPVLFEVSVDSLQRLKLISSLVQNKLVLSARVPEAPSPKKTYASPLYRLRHFLILQSIEKVTVAAGQVSLCGSEGAVGWDSMTLQVGAGPRAERICARALITAAVISTGPPGDARHVLLQPLMLGLELEARWEAWRRMEGGRSAREPVLCTCVETDRVCVDLRPPDIDALARLRDALRSLNTQEPQKCNESEESLNPASSSIFAFERPSTETSEPSDDHFYKDDLRSGAFKIVSDDQLPMAYQVTLYNNAVSWRYPHPRAITRLVAFPLPNQDTETQCVLEVYNPLLSRWESHSHFAIPVSEPVETQLYVTPPDAVFAVMWRYRACEPDERNAPYQFDATRFQPRSDPLMNEVPTEPFFVKSTSGVTVEQLSGVVRVDSCFSPRVDPRLRFSSRFAGLLLHLHNDRPRITSQATSLEGYYVSKPLMRSHRVISLSARDTSVHANLASSAGALVLLHTHVSSDILDCATGTMEHLVDEFRLQAGCSLPVGGVSRARVALSRVHVALHVPRLRTLHSLALDWKTTVSQYIQNLPQDEEQSAEVFKPKRELAQVTAAALEGRVSLWIQNECASALRVGQEGTDEVVPLGPGTSLAYRWRSPTATRKLRFSIAGPSANWYWSSSIPFTAGINRVRLSDAESLTSKQTPGGGVFLYTKVVEHGARRTLHIAGRVCPTNMLRVNLHYKIRIRSEGNVWRTICSGEMAAETIGNSVICNADSEMALKIKLTSQETGWSGDIPLKECPKGNVPWLVKLPSEGEYPFACVWCRVVRARSDGRVLASVWPLYVLYSHLPLDTDVLIATEVNQDDISTSLPLIQVMPGRGTSTHLIAPGTTSARHNLTFQYRGLDCPVTHEAVPLHYGVTDTSVFEKCAPVVSLDEVFSETLLWLERAGQSAVSFWPYSIVSKHWTGKWVPAYLQPRCDVTVRYQAVRAGGGCSLEVQLCPVVLLCNAAPIALTLRAHDAAPLCKLEPGTAISPPSAVLKKPFFISVEMGRETFVSGQLALTGAELGRYGVPARGRLALDHAAELAIQCNNKVALLSMYYEIKEDINVLGMSSTYMLVNRMKTDIMVSAMAVPSELDDDTVLRPSTFKVIEPTAEGSMSGKPLCRFYVVGRWRGSDPTELRLYLCVRVGSARGAAPLRLGHPPLRRALALSRDDNVSIPVVITQIKHEGRWMITVAEDPCPELLLHNKTKSTLCVAQPTTTGDEPSTSKLKVVPDCLGTRWFCAVPPDTITHYSTPGYCARYPPPVGSLPLPHSVTFLTFAKTVVEGEHEWCAPVAITDSEQLLQICEGITVKMRVRTHPQSTHLELRDVDQHDISASDIRRRLIGAFSTDGMGLQLGKLSSLGNLNRVEAEAKLIDPFENVETGAKLDTSMNLASKVSTEPMNPDAKTAPNTSTNPDAPNDPVSATERNVTINTTVSTDPPASNETQNEGKKKIVPSTTVLFTETTRKDSIDIDQQSRRFHRLGSEGSAADSVYQDFCESEWDERASWTACDRLRLVASAVVVELAAAADVRPLIALHLERAALIVRSDARRTKTTFAISDVQIDNMQYESGQYDFAVVASTRGTPAPPAIWPPLWNPFAAGEEFSARSTQARVLLRLTHDTWAVHTYSYRELSEVEIRLGPLALYMEDAYARALAELARAATPAPAPCSAPHGSLALPAALLEEAVLRDPLRLRTLLVHPLDLTLTLHTAVRMYIALDQSPLLLSAFKLHDVMTSTERLTHALTVHYLSAAILGAGWVVGGLELLGAPGALAARVGGATGGVRGVASAAAAALVRSLSAWAGSLARNLDLLAGDEEHARRAAAARRRAPPSLMAGLAAGLTNFAVNILGAVGGLAHHPLVGVAVGETESGATALRRGLIGAFAKPLSATADLVAFAGHGLLSQTGWDPIPQPRSRWSERWSREPGWRRDCVRWVFRLADLCALAGFRVLLDSAPLHLLLTHRFLVVADPDTERIVEMIDFRYCSIGPYQGQIVELSVSAKRQSKVIDRRGDEEDEYQISAAAMARVARYTGAESGGAGGATGVAAGAAGSVGGEVRLLSLLPSPGCAPSLHAALLAAIHHNSPNHFQLL